MQNPFERELEIARQIQTSFLPDRLPQVPGWEIAARFQPARLVAGDFYDVFPLIQGRRLALVIGDVCDTGVGAALFMALFRTLIRAFAQQRYSLRWISDLTVGELRSHPVDRRPVLPSIGSTALSNAVDLTNDYIVNTHGSANMFATLFIGILDPSDGSLLFVNAGHPHPLLVDEAGVRTRLAVTGPALGLCSGAHFTIGEAHLAPGHTLVAFTDGVTEAQDERGELFGSGHLAALLARPSPGAAALLDRIQASVQAHIGRSDPSDDITLLAAHRHRASTAGG